MNGFLYGLSWNIVAIGQVPSAHHNVPYRLIRSSVSFGLSSHLTPLPDNPAKTAHFSYSGFPVMDHQRSDS